MDKTFPKLDSETFLNWLKLGIAIHYTKEGIEPLVIEDTEKFQQEVLKEVYTQNGVSKGTLCSSCCTENLLRCPTREFCNRSKGKACSVHTMPGKEHRTCPNKICDKFVEKIYGLHRFSKPSWKNSNAERWCTEPVELAKCFMPREGYSDRITFQEVDFNGILNVAINNKRFEAMFIDDLSTSDNINVKAREVGKAFRHCPDLGVTDVTFQAYIDILVNVLSDIHCQPYQKKAQDAVKMINQLRKTNLNVSSLDATKVIEDFITKQRKDMSKEIAKHGDCLKRKMQEEQVEFLLHIKNAAQAIRRLTAANLEEIISKKVCAIGEIEEKVRKEKRAVVKDLKRKALKHQKSLCQESKRIKMSIKKEKERAVADVRSSASTSRSLVKRISESEDYPKFKRELQKDLIQLCRKQHINLPVSPVREENEVPLLQFYVAPSLKCKDYEKGPYTNQNIDRSQPISSYNEVFFKGSKECKDIYLASPAGTGKTSYVKRMALAWCFSKAPEDDQNTYFAQEEVNTMKFFDFVFLLSMRDTGQFECSVDEMIKAQIILQLSLSYMYSDEFLQEVLHNEKCLILLDGLDEWSHPNKKCSQPTSKVPHRKVRKKCTMLTTARPWKVDAVIEGKYFIDQHIEMSGLEEPSANKLIDNALSHLNERYHDNKSSDDFTRLLKQNRVHKLKSVPLLLLQLLCLWCTNGQLGDSRCELYSNMLEFLFKHAMKRSSHLETRSTTKKKLTSRTISSDLPRCFTSCQLCHSHRDLLRALGKLAFDGLFDIRPESSLLFNESVVAEYLDTDMLRLCKETGILSQNNACRKLTHTESNYSFIHKTYQEYLAALYITLEWSESLMHQIFLFCSTTVNILQVSNIFIFVSGMNPKVSGELSQKCSEIVSEDEGTEMYRRNIGTLFIRSRLRMHRLHTLMMNCLQESHDNGFQRIRAIAQDVFINSKCKFDWLLEKRLIDKNMNNIRSLDIQADTVQEQVHEMLHSLDVKSLNRLEKLYVWGSLPTQDISVVIQSSLRSLVCLELWHVTFTDDLLSAIWNLGRLEGLSLLSVSMSHNQAEKLMDFLKQTKTIRQLSLNEVKCLDHGQFCSGYTLNLLNNSNLTMLLLDKLHVNEVTIDPKHLNMCVVEWMHKDGALASLLNGLKHAPNLIRFECDGADNPEDLDKLIEVLATLESLKYVRLRNIKFQDRNIDLSRCDFLECIYMWHVNVNSFSLEQLINKIKTLPRTVTVMLESCEVNPSEEYQRLKRMVKNAEEFEVTRDTSVWNKYNEFYFKTIPKK